MSAIEACFMVGYKGESGLMSAIEASDSTAEWLTFKTLRLLNPLIGWLSKACSLKQAVSDLLDSVYLLPWL